MVRRRCVSLRRPVNSEFRCVSLRKGNLVGRINRNISWNQFVVRGLSVKPELLGCSHAFPFDGAKIKITLPAIDRVTERDDDDALVTPGSRRRPTAPSLISTYIALTLLPILDELR